VVELKVSEPFITEFISNIVIVTTTCAVNTDKTTTHSVMTQTLMPRSSVSFKRAFEPRHKIQYAYSDEASTDDDIHMMRGHDELMDIERRLQPKKKLSRQRSSHK
jgi:hypothetical protein